MFGVPYFPDFILRPYTRVKTHAYVDGEIAERFAHGKNPIRPILFSHGLGAHLSFYTATYQRLAAHGYLVLAVNHQDESCFFTRDSEDKDIPYVLKENEPEYRESQIKIRIAEIRSMVQALDKLTPELHFEIFGGFAPNARIDMRELILAGHSYGAATMIATAS